MLTKPRKLY